MDKAIEAYLKLLNKLMELQDMIKNEGLGQFSRDDLATLKAGFETLADKLDAEASLYSLLTEDSGDKLH